MTINPQILALLAEKAGRGDEEAITNLATVISKERPGDPPTIAAAPKQPFPVSPQGGGPLRGSPPGGSLQGAPPGVSIGNRPTPLPAVSQAAPQALAAASNQSPLGGGVPGGGGQGADIGGIIQAALPIILSLYGGGAFGGGGGAGGAAGAGALGGILGGAGGGAGAGSSAGQPLPGGLPDGSAAGAAGAGINPLEALQAPTPGEPPQQLRAPAAVAPRPGGGQINPQILQLIMQALSAGQQPSQVQSLGQILGQTR